MLCEVCKGGFKESDLVVCAVPMASYFTRICHDCLNPTDDPRHMDFTEDKALFRCADGYRRLVTD